METLPKNCTLVDKVAFCRDSGDNAIDVFWNRSIKLTGSERWEPGFSLLQQQFTDKQGEDRMYVW